MQDPTTSLTSVQIVAVLVTLLLFANANILEGSRALRTTSKLNFTFSHHPISKFSFLHRQQQPTLW